MSSGRATPSCFIRTSDRHATIADEQHRTRTIARRGNPSQLEYRSLAAVIWYRDSGMIALEVLNSISQPIYVFILQASASVGWAPSLPRCIRVGDVPE